MIEFESVSKTFRDGTTAVDNLSLVVPSGKITVIVGPSGCGKTTTLRMVNRMLEPTKGKITWDDKPIKSRRKTTLRRQMGYVIQSGGLFPHRTVLENISTVPDLLKWDKPKSRKRATELLANVGLDRKLGDRYPAQLSGGQQQRVGVARALAADPLVLLMDEPFSAVDPVVRGELHEFFLGLQRQLSKTIIMITHDIDEAIRLGDQVAILRVGGRLAQVGTPQQVLDEPADSFVEGFVGKDRGYRSLSFQPASGLALGDVQVVREAGAARGEAPVLVVDADARPVGWVDPARPGAVTPLGATFDPETDAMRAALDAALTSPVGLAVAVSGEPRRYAGVVDVEMILRHITQTRAQIAESIAVRTHDESTSSPVTSGPAGPPATPVPTEGTPAYDDPEATSVRGVPPVETAAEVGTVAAAGAVVHDATQPRAADAPAVADASPGADRPEVLDDPDATRIAPPLAEQHEEVHGSSVVPGPASAETGEQPATEQYPPAPVAREPYAPAPDQHLTEPDQYSGGPDQYSGGPDQDSGGPDQYPTEPHAPERQPPASEQQPPASAQYPPAADAPQQHAPEQYSPAPDAPEQYAPETHETAARSAENETGATAYDAQPAAEGALADRTALDQPPAERPAASDDDDREPPR